MTQYEWEVVGCVLVLAGLGIGALLFGRWLDDQGEQEWLEADE